MSNRLKTGRHLLLSCSALFPILLASSPALPQAVNLGGAGNFIVPDGRTQTSVSNSGNVTDVRTNTVRGDVGFNSFSRFEAGAGNTVNLHLAPNTGTLVNVVRDAPVVVEGTVNALKNGTIGGNVVFSDPYGFVLGKDGVINTGGLTVNTPTREFLEGAIGSDGRIDVERTNRLISGDVPISPDGSVVIRGRVNAQTHVDIHAASIDIDPEAKLRRHRENFEASVNAQGGVAQGGALVVRDGRIQLVATGDVRVGGSLAARATSRESAANGAGRVAIRAGGNVTVTPTARIEALAAIAREEGPQAVAAIVGIEAGKALELVGDVQAIGEGGAGASVNLTADRIAVKAGALIAAQIEAGARSASVSVAAARDLAFDGRIEARGAEGTRGGNVDLRAGGDIAQGAASSIEAGGEGGSAGGEVYVVATRDLAVASGAVVTARGSGNADGGFAELSGHRAVSLGSALVDLRSEGGGKAGTLLIDPEEIEVLSGTTLTALANQVYEATKSIRIRTGGKIVSSFDGTKGFDISLKAPTITVESGGIVDSRVIGGTGLAIRNSGSIRMEGRTIDLQAGSVVRADGGNGFAGGNVTLLARDSIIKSSGVSGANASITINGELRGQDVSAVAIATASAKWNETDVLNEDFAFFTTTDLLSEIAKLSLRFPSLGISKLPLAIDAGFNSAETSATVTVGATADIAATGDLELAAVGSQVAENLGMNPTTGAALQLGVFGGVVSAETAVRIASGAQVDVAGNLSVTAQNSAKLSVNAFNLGLKDTPITGAIAVGVADIATKAEIASGAVMTVGGRVRVAADNINSFAVSATSMSLQDGVAGAAVAIQHHDVSAVAALDATIGGRNGGKVGDVLVTSVSETLLNSTTASVTLGDSALIRLARNKVGAGLANKLTGKFPSLTSFTRNSPVASLAQDEMPKGAVAFSLGLGTQEATARIGDGVTIDSSGNVAVVSDVLDFQVRSNADVSISSAEEKGDGPKTTTGVGIAINIAEYDHRSHATIGRNADIAAANVGLSANSSLPINIAYHNAKTPLEWVMTIKNALNGNLGVVKNILTSYAASEVTSDTTGIGASINYLGLGHDVLSWVGSGATITTRDSTSGTFDAAVRVAPVSGSSVGVAAGNIRGRTFAKGADISARSLTETINIAGNPAWLIVIGGNASTSPEGRSLGGSFSLTSFDAKTIAGIGAGATVTSARDLKVLAERTDTIFTVAPSAGGGAGFGVSGILAMTMIDNDTSAAIDSRAVVSAANVALDARQHSQIVSIAGALNAGNGVNVGLSANWSNILTDTRAFVGNTDDLVSGTLANAARTPGSVTTNALTVSAKTTGDIYALSVTAALSMPNSGEKGRVDKAKDSISGFVGGRADKHKAFASANDGLLGKLSGKVGGLLGDLAPAIAAKPTPAGQKPQFSLAAAGSVTGATLGMKTAAFLDGADVKRLAGTGGVGVAVDALNDTLISVTSGAASIALVGQDSAKSSGAVAGAVAVAVTENDVYAGIRNSTLSQAGTTNVRALSSGQQIVLGLGLAVNTNANSAYSLAGSVSFGFVFDNVKAEIANSSVTAAGSDRDVSVKAYQNTDIGIGGLAVSVATSGAGGFGLALTGTVIADTSDPLGDPTAKAVSATISDSSLSGIRNATVDAATLSRVLSGAGSVGVAPNGLGFTGSIVFNDISGSTYAAITGSPGNRIDASGNVLVRSGATRTSDIASELSGLIRNTAIASGFDFSGTVLDTDTSGSVILAVAGAVGVGKNSAGFSILYNGVRHSHEALIEGVTIESDGDTKVSATDDTKIIGTAAGISVATGEFGGAGSIVVDLVKNKTAATVRNATLSARDVEIVAQNTSFIAGGAGAVGIGASAQGTGLGLSLISGAIANDTDATVSGGSITASRDVSVGARSAGTIVTAAVSVGAGGTVGIAGSIANSVAANDARALVNGAAITADNNVLVGAKNADSIHTVAGAVGVSLKAAGVGLSTVVNVVRGETVAAVDGGSVVAKGLGQAASVDNGKVATAYAYNVENFGKSLVLIPADLSNGTRQVSGLSVGAISQQKVSSGSLAVAVAINADSIVSVAGAVSPVVNVLGGKTEARLDGTAVNTSGAAGSDADVSVVASSNTFTQNAVVAAAGATGVAGAGGFVSNVMERETKSVVRGATIGASGSVGAVDVVSNAVMDSSNLVAGLSVGLGAVAGSMIVNVFDADTTAQFDGGSLAARSLSVKADTDTGFLGAAGSGAAGAVAVAGAMNVSVNLGSTNALVGSSGRDTQLVLSEDLTVAATSKDEQRAFVVGGAVSTGGGGAAVAGMMNFSVLLSDTVASVSRLTASSMRNVSVTATHDVELLPVTGGFGIAVDGVGVGAAANVMLTKSHVRSEIVDSAFTASGRLDVDALGRRRIEMVTATLGAGGSAGIGAAIGIVVAGLDMSGEARGELGETLGAANRQSNQTVGERKGENYTSQGAGTLESQSGDPTALTRKNVVADSLANTKRDSVTARIVGGSITAGTTEVEAQSGVRVRNFALGAGIGGGVGVGAAVGYTFVGQAVTASVTGTHTLSSLKVAALAGDYSAAPAGSIPAAVANRPAGQGSILTDGSVTVTSIAGAGGLIGGAGAAVAVAQINSAVGATLGGTVTSTGNVSVSAADTTSVRSNAIGAAVAGGVAVGIAVAVADRDSTVVAGVAENGTVNNAAKVSVDAVSQGAARALSIAGAGGLLGAGVGASATAIDNSRVLAQLSANTRLLNIGSGGIGLTARSTPDLQARSIGATVGGVGAVGASIAIARLTSDVAAIVGSNARLTTTGAVNLSASHALATSGRTADAQAIAGAGGGLFSAQASVAQARTAARTRAAILDDAEVEAANSEVKATTVTRQNADVTGIAVAGGLAVGATVAEARSANDTVAELGSRVRVRANDLSILANGEDGNNAVAEAGGGALIAGIAATSTTATTSSVLARLGAGDLGLDANSGSDDNDVVLGGRLTVKAEQLSLVNGSVSSVKASLAGQSGAIVNHSVATNVEATIADGVLVTRASDLTLAASNRTQRVFGQGPIAFASAGGVNVDGSGWNVRSGSGGVIDAPAAVSVMTISHTTRATIGANASILLPRRDKSALDRSAYLSDAKISAYNEIVVFDKVRLDSGGAIAVARASARVDVTKNEAEVLFGAGSRVVLANGNLAAAAYDNAHIDIRTAGTTWGLAGAPIGDADVLYRRANRLTVGQNALVEASSDDDAAAGRIRLHAGATLDGALSSVTARAFVDLFNKTAIAIPTTPNPLASVSGDSVLTIQPSILSGTGVRAAGNIHLTASRGNVDVNAVGTGKDIYRESLATIVNGVASLFGVDNVTFDYKGGSSRVAGQGLLVVDGTVETGIERKKSLVVGYADSCGTLSLSCLNWNRDGGIEFDFITGVSLDTTIIDRIAELKVLLATYGRDPIYDPADSALPESQRRIINQEAVLAKAAYTAEIAYYEGKLQRMGLAADGATLADLSDYALRQRVIANTIRVLSGLGATVGSNTSAVLTSAGVSLDQTATTFDAATGLQTSAETALDAFLAVRGDLSSLSGYKGDTNDDNKRNLAIIGNAASFIQDAEASIATARTAISTARGLIQTNLATIRDTPALIDAKLTEIANATDATRPALIRQVIELRKTLATAIDVVATAQATIETQTTIIDAQTASFQTNLTDLRTAFRALVTNSATADSASAETKADDNGRRTRIEAALTSKDTVLSSLGTGAVTIKTATVAVAGEHSNATSAKVSVGSYLAEYARLAADEAALPNDSQGTPIPTTGDIRVKDTTVRLGDIVITADRVEGGADGRLSAPGDAEIVIENRTSNILTVGNLTVDGSSGGRILVNGGNARDRAAMGRFLPGGAALDAGFEYENSTTTTAPAIVIENVYDSGSPDFYDPNSSSWHKVAKRPAPDLKLSRGALISNALGSVTVRSARGNVYDDASIQARSLTITARNGDYLQSYDHRPRHIAGDPFNGGGGGAGHQINGEVRISARVLNINGLVRSGYADRKATISNTDLWLIGAADQIELTDSQRTAMANFRSNRNNQTVLTLESGLEYRFVAGDGQRRQDTYELWIRPTLADAKLKKDTGTLRVVTDEFLADRSNESIVDVRFTVDFAANGQRSAGRFVVLPTEVRGGHIELFGQIMSTGGGVGRIEVLDGFGQIKIDNKTVRSLSLADMDAGRDAAGGGRGTAGYLKITDIRDLSRNARGVGADSQTIYAIAAYETEYTRQLVNGAFQMFRKERQGAIGTNGSFAEGAFSSNGASFTTASVATAVAQGGDGRSATYDVQDNLRYITQEAYSQTTTTTTNVSEKLLFGISGAVLSRTVTRGTPVVVSSDPIRRDNGAVVVVDPTKAGSTALSVSATINQDVSSSTSNSSKSRESADLGFTRIERWVETHVLNKTVVTTTSHKADYDIGIRFIGADTGSIDIGSVGGILLGGDVGNVSTTVKIAATGTTAGIGQTQPHVTVVGKDIDLSAGGSIGSIDADAPILVTLGGGRLAAQAGGDIAIATDGGLALGAVTAGNRVSLFANTDIVAASAGQLKANETALVQARRVDLASAYGSIGALGNQLTVNTATTTTAADRPFGDPTQPGVSLTRGYGLSATASGNIGIRSTSWTDGAGVTHDGTMLVDRVVAGGSVKLTSDGAILDNNPEERIDQRTIAELDAWWSDLGLTGADATAKAAEQIAAFESQAALDRKLQRELQARTGGVYDKAFVYSADAAERAALGNSLRAGDAENRTRTIAEAVAAFEIQLRKDRPGLTEPEFVAQVEAFRLATTTTYDRGMDARVATSILQFEASQTRRYHDVETSLAALTGSFAADGSYTAGASEQASFNNGVAWSDAQLLLSLSAGALKTITGTNPVIKLANVSGDVVTLDAAKGIGEATQDFVINIQSDGTVVGDNGLGIRGLSQRQRIALSTAERSDFLAVSGPSELLRIRQLRMLNFDARTRLDMSVAAGDAHLASLGTARLGAVTVPGELRVKVRGSIVNAADERNVSVPGYSPREVAAGSYILEAANGGIGWSRNAVTGDPEPGTLRIRPVNTGGTAGAYNGTIIARGADTVSVTVVRDANVPASGDANIDTVYSRKDIEIEAHGDIRNANTDRLINVLGETILLKAGGSIGSQAHRLAVGNGLAGAVTADAGGSAYLFAPDGYRLTLAGAVARGGVLDILAGDAAPGDILLAGPLSATGNAVFQATGRIAFDGAASVLSGGNAVLKAAAIRMIEGSSLTADGTISVETVGDAQLTTLEAGASGAGAIRVDAGGRILAGTTAGRVDLTASAADGGVVLEAGAGIGDRLVANTALGVADATNVLNHLRIDASAVDAKSGGGIALHLLRDIGSSAFRAGGDVDLVADGSLLSSLVLSKNGSIGIAAAGETDATRIEAARAFAFDGAAGATFGSVLTGGAQTITATGDLSFGSLTSSAGDIATLSQTGSVRGTAVNAGGFFASSAKGPITADAIRTGTSASLASGEGIAVRDTDAGTGVTADAGTTLVLGSVRSGGAQQLSATGDLSFGSLTSTGPAGDIAPLSRTGSVRGTTVTAAGLFASSAKGSITADTIRTGTSASLASGDAIAVRETDAGTSVTADAGTTLVLGSVRSRDAQRLSAKGDLSFGSLTSTKPGGDIATLSRTGSVRGTTVTAAGLFASSAKGSITADVIRTGTSVSLASGEGIAVRETDAGTSVTADAGTTLVLGSVRSEGAQQLSATGDLSFGSLTSTGPAGDIATLSRTGSVRGTAVNAGGIFASSAKGSITVDAIRTGTSVSLASGEGIAVLDTEAGTSVTADAGTTLTTSRVVSGGSQQLTATGDLVFGFLKSIGISADAGDISLLSRKGGVLGGAAGTVDAARDLTIDAGLGLTFGSLTAGRDMRIRIGGDLEGIDLNVGRELDLRVGGTKGVTLRKVTGRDLVLSTAGPLNVETVATSDRAAFRTPELRLGTLQYTGSTVLGLDITGFEGAMARYAQLAIDAPAIAMNQLHVIDSRFRTNAFSISLADGRVPGSMEWLTPWRTIWMNNRLQQPTLGHDVQLYQPSGSFFFDQLGNRTGTTSYVVRYGLGSNIHQLFNGETYLGASFIRNFEAAMQDPSNDLPGLEGRERSLLGPNFGSMMNRFRLNEKGSVTKGIEGPAVNLGGDADEDEDDAVLEEATLR